MKKVSESMREALPGWVMGAVERLSEIVDPYAVRSYSQEGEDMILRRLFEGRATGFYIDVGAHHPRRFSNTWHFYQRGWHGLNIDPNPETIHLLQHWRPNDLNLKLGISDSPGEQRYFVFNESALNTFDPVLAKERQRIPGYKIINTVSIHVVRLDEVFYEHLQPNQIVDFMSIDVEGMDLSVAKSNDWGRFRPRYLLVEAIKSSLAHVADYPLHRYLCDQGYELFAKTLNTLMYCDLAAQ